jgi:hypothetical protein
MRHPGSQLSHDRRQSSLASAVPGPQQVADRHQLRRVDATGRLGELLRLGAMDMHREPTTSVRCEGNLALPPNAPPEVAREAPRCISVVEDGAAVHLRCSTMVRRGMSYRRWT